MRITLLIDIEIRDISRLQKYLEMQPGLTLVFEDNWTCGGRFVGARETLDIPKTETKGGP